MSKFKSIKGRKFGKLLVKEEFKENKVWKVECVCDCGQECIKLKCHLLTGGTASCGCARFIVSAKKNWKGYEEISGDYWTCLRRGAEKRGFAFDISIEYAWRIFNQQNAKCAISGEPICFVAYSRRKNSKNQTASLDRIDSNKGYIEGNVWWVHKEVNRLKSNFSLSDFLTWSQKITLNNQRGINYAKWDKRFIMLAKHIATWSKDPSTQVGAVIFDSNHRIISTGYNGLAQRVPDTGLEDRDKKLKTIIHAETNAILFAQRDLSGCTLATWPFQPCSNCSSIIIQANIARCIFPKAEGERASRWESSFNSATAQFSEAGVIVQEYDLEEFES